MSELPNGWALAPIGSLCKLENGRAFKPTEWTTQGLPIVRIQNLNNPNASYNYFSGEFDSRYHLRGGELLFAWSGTPGTSFGAHVWRGGEAVLNQHIFRVDFDESFLDKRFFRYAINQKLDELIDIAHGGVGLRHVTKGKFENTEISLPPLNEQKRIAAKLDALLKRVDACRARLERVPLLLKRFRQAVLAAATSGQLTEDWREAQGTTFEDWQLHNFGDVIFELRNGWGLKPTEEAEGKAILRISSVRPFNVNFKNIRYLSPNAQAQTYLLQTGDLLFTRYNGTLEFVGVCALVRELPTFPVVYPDKLIRVRVDETQTLPGFIEIVTNAPATRDVIENLAKTSAGQTGISGKDLKGLRLLLPPLEEQAEIVRRVETLFAYADRLEARYQQARAAVERLTPALLAKAFRGELVPQDPHDEPARVLLARLQAARANGTAATKAKGVARRQPAAAAVPLFDES